MTTHAPERPGPDGLGYGKCTSCGEIWPCSSSRPATPAELHAYVVARWTEHRATAQAAMPWPDVGVVIEGTEQGTAFVASDFTVDHIAANDPAHVIAVCDAALRRLARHAPDEDDDCPECVERGTDGHEPDGSRYVNMLPMPYPCPEVLDDAAPWADRVDFPDQLRRPA